MKWANRIMSINIVVMGGKGVGKKSLINYLQGGSFSENYQPAKENTVAVLKFTHLDKPLTVEVWNIIGISKLQRANGVIMMYNGKKPSMEQWCKDQKNIRFLHGDESLPIETCTNKMDLYSYDKLFESNQDLSSTYEGTPISAKEGFGLLKVFSNLLRRMEYYPKNLKFPKILFGTELTQTKIEVKAASNSFYLHKNGMIGVTHEFLTLEQYLDNYNEIERELHKSDNSFVFDVKESNPREVHFAYLPEGIVKITSQYYKDKI